MALTAEQTGAASLVIREGNEIIAEIRDLRLQNVRFRPGGSVLIGREVPLPLFWEQYADHQHPERNAGSNGSIRILDATASSLRIVCRGTTGTGSMASIFDTTFSRNSARSRYEIEIRASLRVPEGHTWCVTPNPHHGEVEFCNIWPDKTFSTDTAEPIRYGACYVDHGDRVVKIPHHHLESSDKHNIALRAGSRLIWLLEEENLCVTMLSDEPVSAGMCAYMWDAHLGYKICTGGRDVVLPAGSAYTASYRLSTVDRQEGTRLVRMASAAPATEADETPVIVDGVHTFTETCATTQEDPLDAWPWETEVLTGAPGGVRFLIDRTCGWDDRTSIRVDSPAPARAVWKATALGPAFRQAEFHAGERYRLGAYVKTDLGSGAATIAIRLHRSGTAGLYDPAEYEVYRCPARVTGSTDWTYLEVTTPPVSPAADRVHLLLEVDGSGSCWFDTVHFTRET